MILHRKTKATGNHIHRHVNQGSTEGERTRAKHQERFIRWDVELDLNNAGRLMDLELVCRANLGVIRQKVIASSLDVQQREGGSVGGEQRCTQLAITQRSGFVAVHIKNTDVDCPNPQRKCKDCTDAGGSGAFDERRPAIDDDVVWSVQVRHQNRRAEVRSIDTRALAKGQLKILDASRNIIGGTHNPAIARGGHHGDTRTAGAEHSHSQ